MRYIYDRHTLQAGEDPFKVATQWGNDGWRWINATTVPWQTATMIFELEVQA